MIVQMSYQKPSTNYVADFQRPVGDIYGVVSSNGSAVSRQVELYDRQLKTLLETTTSNGSGNYTFLDHLNRSITSNVNGNQGYSVIMRGDLGSGEVDVIVSGVEPDVASVDGDVDPPASGSVTHLFTGG